AGRALAPDHRHARRCVGGIDAQALGPSSPSSTLGPPMSPHGRLVLVTAVAVLLGAPPAIGDDAASDGRPAAAADSGGETPDYDPWQPFNERTFWFNYYLLDKLQHGIANAFDNISMPPRLVNKLLQVRPRSAGEEIARFVVNTIVGVVGFIDVAERLGVHGSGADAGQTLGVWGVGAGPYLVLPFLPPLTVRDGIGYGADSAMDPVGYVFRVPLAVSLSTSAVRRVNERSLQPAAYE